MKSKFLALGLSVLSFGFLFAPESSAARIRPRREKIASEIQIEIIKETNRSKRQEKIANIQRKIRRIQAEIRRLEKVRSELDHKLCVNLQLLEAFRSAGLYSVNHEYKLLLSKVKKLRAKISANENHIKNLKSEIEKLDAQLSIQLQLEELGY